MLEETNLISYDESKQLYLKQSDLIKSFRRDNNCETLIRIALLQTLSPICDAVSALKILESNLCDDYNLLVIGAYFVSENYNYTKNIFLDHLLSLSDMSDFQKSIVKYLMALQLYNRNQTHSSEILEFLDESIVLFDKYAANYYLRYLITHNPNDLKISRQNVNRIIADSDITSLSIDELIEPLDFINERILMNRMPESTFKAVFDHTTIH